MSRRRHWQGGQGRGGGARGEGVPCNSFHTGACNRLVAFSRASLSNSSSPGSDAEAESLVDMLLNEPSLCLNELSLPLTSSVESPTAGGRGRDAINESSCALDPKLHPDCIASRSNRVSNQRVILSNLEGIAP